MEENKPKFKSAVEGLDQLALGISIVIAVMIGVGVGYALTIVTGYSWMLWVGVFWGIAAAGLNIKKAYERLKKELDTPLKSE